MSYPGVDPAEYEDDSAGATKLVETSQKMHDAALNGGETANTKLKQAVKEVIDEFSISSAWGKSGELTFVIECPSGQKCLAKHLDTMDLIDANLLDEIDYFSKKLMPKAIDAAGNPVEAEESEFNNISSLLKDLGKRSRLFSLLDGLLQVGVVKPKVHRLPTSVKIEDYRTWEGPELPPGEVWANMIDFSDKMFIFAELNKPLDEIKSFRVE
jgi:hypothetical protein